MSQVREGRDGARKIAFCSLAGHVWDLQEQDLRRQRRVLADCPSEQPKPDDWDLACGGNIGLAPEMPPCLFTLVRQLFFQITIVYRIDSNARVSTDVLVSERHIACDSLKSTYSNCCATLYHRRQTCALLPRSLKSHSIQPSPISDLSLVSYVWSCTCGQTYLKMRSRMSSFKRWEKSRPPRTGMCGIWRADCGEAASRRRDFERKCLRRPMLVG